MYCKPLKKYCNHHKCLCNKSCVHVLIQDKSRGWLDCVSRWVFHMYILIVADFKVGVDRVVMPHFCNHRRSRMSIKFLINGKHFVMLTQMYTYVVGYHFFQGLQISRMD